MCNDKKCETYGIKYKDCHLNMQDFLEDANSKDNLTKYICLYCNKNYLKKFDENLKKWIFNTCKFSNCDIKFILLLSKGVYPYEYLDDWKKLNEALPEIEDFYSHLNMEDIIDADYPDAKRVCKDFEMKFFWKYQNFYVQSDTLLLDVFENFQNMS